VGIELKEKAFQCKTTVDDVSVCDWCSVRGTGGWIHITVWDLRFHMQVITYCGWVCVGVFWQLRGCFG